MENAILKASSYSARTQHAPAVEINSFDLSPQLLPHGPHPHPHQSWNIFTLSICIHLIYIGCVLWVRVRVRAAGAGGVWTSLKFLIIAKTFAIFTKGFAISKYYQKMEAKILEK